MELVIDQPKDKAKDEILLRNRCVFYQEQFLGKNGAEPIQNEQVSGVVSDMYAAMDEYSLKECVEFVEWANRNYTYVELNLWDGDDDETFTTYQIYSMYLKSKT